MSPYRAKRRSNAETAPAGTTTTKGAIHEHRHNLLIVLILMLVGASSAAQPRWGYGPSGIAGVLVIGLIVLVLMGRI